MAGRLPELALLADALSRAVDARVPSAVVVHGEAGVGKTHLVSAVAGLAEEQGFAVLWGSCVRFEAATVPYAPVIGALEHWLTRPAEEVPGDVRSAMEGIGPLAHGLDGPGATRLIPAIGAVIASLCAHRPVLLVIDDVHWADATSLDVLAYLVTGFRAQPLVIVATARDEELGTGHPLHSWLADLRRLPSVSEVRLGRLDLAETEQQVAAILGGPAAPALVDDVHRLSAGNAYLTELLVRSLEPGASQLPADLPVALREALLRSWHTLAADARTTVQVVAVGGRPIRHRDLARICHTCGVPEPALSASLVEAIGRGVLAASTDGHIWFHHPLTAEVVEGTLLPGQAERVHEAFVAHLAEADPPNPADRLRRHADLARHHELAGDADAAFGYAVQAAGEAARLQGFAEEAAHLRHAVELWPHVTTDARDAYGDLVSLLRDAADAANRAGDDQAAFTHADRARRLVDRTEDPRLAARLLCEWCGLVFRTGRVPRYPLAEAQEALELTTSAAPESVEHVLALATVAEAEAWRGNGEAARRYVTQAMDAAASCADPEGTVWALAARAFVLQDEPSAVADAAEANRRATASGHHQVAGRAAVWWSHALWDRGRFRESAETAAFAFEQASTTRPAAASTAYLAGLGAERFLALGEPDRARELLREGLALRTSGIGAKVRLTATLLAVMSGRLDEAGQHLRRVEELIPTLSDHVGLVSQPVYAAYLLATGRPDEAVDLVRRTMPSQGATPRRCDTLLVWGARACADLAQRARDRNDRAGVDAAGARLDALVELRVGLGHGPFEHDDAESVANEARFLAESARCRQDRGTLRLWQRAVDSCHACGFGWEEAHASLRLAEAMAKDGGHQPGLAAAVRRTHRIAAGIGAVPLRDEAVALARLARISLDEPALPGPADEAGGSVRITRREHEILAHLVVGRSYREIAGALFISEKTVSVHVSNLLRKTDTANRHELSALARRLGIVTST